MEKEHYILRGETPDGEPQSEVHAGDGNVLWRVTGEGEKIGGVISHGEFFPGQVLLEGVAASEEAKKKLIQEMKDAGATRMGNDSPDLVGALGKKQHGWTPQFGGNFDQAFGHN